MDSERVAEYITLAFVPQAFVVATGSRSCGSGIFATLCIVTSTMTSSLESGPTKELFVFQFRLKLAIQDLLTDDQHWKEDGVLLFPNGLTDSLAILKL